jgi:hypothetical protein
LRNDNGRLSAMPLDPRPALADLVESPSNK